MSLQKKEGKTFLKCNKCGFTEAKKDLISKEKIPPAKKLGEGVKGGENEFVTYNHKCKKCGYEKAQIIDAGIFYSDEDNLIMIKCGRCGHSERIGSPT